MLTAKARIPKAHGELPVLPLAIPDSSAVRAFAHHLHSLNKSWKGELFGQQVEYLPESRKKPIDSKMTFTPAEFWIGEGGTQFFSLLWECGKHRPPIEFLDDRALVRT